MRYMITSLFMMLALGSVAHAQNSIKPVLGFSQGAVNFGVDFEHALDNSTGVGGYFHYASKDTDSGKPQVISLGGFMPVHFTNDNKYFDTYLAPGFGISMVDVPAGDDKTVMGPSLKLGFMYKLNATMKLGLDHFHIVNWFEDTVSANSSFTNAAMSFAF